MSKTAIRVRDLVKDYPIYEKPADLLIELVTRRSRHSSFRALNGVSFDVAPGEVIGIIGRNGAGKSTLLKVLTGVLEADAGVVEVNGRTAAILELGTGLNPEYSGRDNVFFGQVCRGISPREAKAKLDEVVAFAELEGVIDRPFKTYSSGMQARLLFATSIHVESEVLIIDEALAAGDILFQEKCFRKMREIASSGRSVLFVSHGLDLVQQLCHRAILMHAGEILSEGDTGEVTKAYYDLAAHIRNDSARGLVSEKTAGEARLIVEASRQKQRLRREQDDVQPASRPRALSPARAEFSFAPPAGSWPCDPASAAVVDAPHHAVPAAFILSEPANDDASPQKTVRSEGVIELLSVRTLNDRLEEADALEYGREFFISARFRSSADIAHLITGMEVRLPTGFLIFTIQNTLEGIDFGCRADEPFEVRWRVENHLQNGTYFVGIGIGEVLFSNQQGLRHSPFTILAQELNAQIFTVCGAREFAGVIDMRPEMRVIEKDEGHPLRITDR